MNHRARLTVERASRLTAYAAVSLWLSSVMESEGWPVTRVDFDSTEPGAYKPADLKRHWGDIAWSKLDGRARLVDVAGDSSNRALRVAYPKDAVGPEEGGVQFVAALPPAAEYRLSYRVLFEEGFDFRLGGKLPGLTSGGDKYTGGLLPRKGDGWSARFMWSKNGKAIVYFYYVDMPGPWGASLELKDAVFVPGTWHRLTQYIRINTPGRADGVMEVWFDGRRVLARSDIRYRVGQQGLIDAFYFSTFHGGNTKEWAPRHDSFARFDDFQIDSH